MHARSQSLIAGDPRQERRKGIPLFRAQRGQQGVLVIVRHPADRLKNLAASRRELQQIDPAVAGVFEPLDEPSFLQLVHERDQPAREHAEPVRHLLLAGAGRGGDDAETAGVRWRQSERTEPLGELRGRMSADLCDQKRG
jgi:hypothetical protein